MWALIWWSLCSHHRGLGSISDQGATGGLREPVPVPRPKNGEDCARKHIWIKTCQIQYAWLVTRCCDPETAVAKRGNWCDEGSCENLNIFQHGKSLEWFCDFPITWQAAVFLILTSRQSKKTEASDGTTVRMLVVTGPNLFSDVPLWYKRKHFRTYCH